MPSEWASMRGRRVVLTGATRGIGLAAAQGLATAGAELVLVARDPARGAAARGAVLDAAPNAGGTVDVLVADLASQAGIVALAAEIRSRYERVDVLLNNAGALYGTRHLTADGIELTWAVNHLAPFLLTGLLLDALRAADAARVVTTSSEAHRGARIPFDDLRADRGYRLFGFARYGETKLANILFTSELAQRLAKTSITVNCLHPGVVRTGFNRNNGRPMDWLMRVGTFRARTPAQGADTLLWLATDPAPANVSGGYFTDRHLLSPSPIARDPATAARLWAVSMAQTHELVGGVFR